MIGNLPIDEILRECREHAGRLWKSPQIYRLNQRNVQEILQMINNCGRNANNLHDVESTSQGG